MRQGTQEGDRMSKWVWECIVPDCDLLPVYVNHKKVHNSYNRARRGGRNHLEKYHGIFGEEPIIRKVK